VKVLFIAANAYQGDKLALDEEYRAIEESIRKARHREAFQLIAVLAARQRDLQQALLDHRPDVVHFACHGNSQEEILLLDEGPALGAVSAEALASLFRVLHDNLALVVFNACFASGQAAAIRQHAGIAIGMRERIEDSVSIAFATSLYGALAGGCSVLDAFDLAVAAVEAMDARWRRVPELFVGSGWDAGSVRLAGRAGPRWILWAAALAVLGAALLVAWLARSAPSEPALVPPPGMARFAAMTLHRDALAASDNPVVCPPEDGPAACAVLPLGPGEAVALAAFDLDVNEVTNSDYARWLMRRADLWTVTEKGVVRTRGVPEVPLVLASEKCGGGLTVIGEDLVVVEPRKASWPVVCVTWHGASEYCREQNKRLPLEAEWELAARGREGRAFPWGAAPPHQDGVAFDLRDGASPHPRDVGTSPQDVSPEGIRDLGGNVAEWVEDGRGTIDRKTIRGGSWASRGPCNVLGSSCKRVALGPGGPYGPDLGFRCASSVVETMTGRSR
jgi:formylglycine-generating enzyme required for sulfatase activity